MTCCFAAAAICDEMNEKVVSYRWTADESVHKVVTQDKRADDFRKKRVFCRGNRGKLSQGHENIDLAFDVERRCGNETR